MAAPWPEWAVNRRLKEMHLEEMKEWLHEEQSEAKFHARTAAKLRREVAELEADLEAEEEEVAL